MDAKLKKSSYRRPGTNLYVNPTSSQFDTRNPYTGQKNFGVWENKPVESTVPAVKAPNPNDSKVSGVWESDPARPFTDGAIDLAKGTLTSWPVNFLFLLAHDPNDAKISGVFENEPEKLFDPNYEKKKEEHEYIQQNLTPGIIAARKAAVEQQHREFDLLGTNTQSTSDQQYIESNLKPGSIREKQMSIKKAQERFENYGKSDAEIEQIKLSKQFLSLSDTESELSVVHEKSNESLMNSETDAGPTKMQTLGKVDKQTKEEESSAWDTTKSSSTSTLNKTIQADETGSTPTSPLTTSDSSSVVENETMIASAQPKSPESSDDESAVPNVVATKLVQNQKSSSSDSDSEDDISRNGETKGPEQVETANVDDTSSWTLTCSSEGEIPQEERPTSPFHVVIDNDVARLEDVEEEDEEEVKDTKVYGSSAYITSDGDVSDIVVKRHSSISSSSSSSSTATLVEEEAPKQEDSLLTSIMKDVNGKVDEPKQMQSVPIDEVDSSAWNESTVVDPQVHLEESINNADTSSNDDSRDKLAFELTETNTTIQRNGNQRNKQKHITRHNNIRTRFGDRIKIILNLYTPNVAII